MAPLRHAVHILPEVMGPASAADPGEVSAFAPLKPKLVTLVDDLLWWSTVLGEHRHVDERSQVEVTASKAPARKASTNRWWSARVDSA